MKDRIDYAPFFILADKKMQQLYGELKSGRFKEASMLVEDLVAEVRLLQIAVRSHLE